MLKKICYIEKKNPLAVSFIALLKKNNFEYCNLVANSESLIVDISKHSYDMFIIDFASDVEQKSIEIIKEITENLNLPFVFYTKSFENFNIDRFLNFNIYGVISEAVSNQEFLINIKLAFKRFYEDKKNKNDIYFLEEAQHLSNIGHWQYDFESSILQWSDETYRIFEIDKNLTDITIEKFSVTIHPEDRKKVEKAYKESLQKRIPYEIEHRILVNGKEKHVIERCKTLYLDDRPSISIGTVQDITIKKRIELELKKSEDRFLELTETLEEVFWLGDWKTKKVLYISPAHKKLYEQEIDDVINNPSAWEDRIHPDDLAWVGKEYWENAGKGTYDVEFRIVMNDGRVKWVHERAYPILENGEVVRVAGYVSNITEQKRIEFELKESEERYRTLFNNNASGLYRIEVTGIVLECNDAFAKQIGLNMKSQLVGKNIFELVDFDKDIITELRHNNGVLTSYQTMVKLKCGQVIRLIQNIILYDREGIHCSYIEGSTIDTTSLMEAENAKKMFEVIPSENPNPVLRVDYEMNTLFVNQAAKSLKTKIVSNGKLYENSLIKFLKDFLSKKDTKKYIEVKLGNKYFLFYAINILEYEYINLYGTDITSLEEVKEAYFDLNINLEKLVTERTKELKATVSELNKEIHSKEKVQNELKQSLREKQVLLNEISHRVKNNLQVIASLISLQKSNIVDGKSQEDLLLGTGHRIKSMALIHETLYRSSDFSKVDFQEYLDSLISYIVNSFDSKDVKINLDISPVDLTIDTATSCGMIAMEVITNSMKYAFPVNNKGTITITFNEIEDGFFFLEISDDGVGMPKSYDFKQVNTLGIQLVYGLAEQLNGKAKLINSNKGLTTEIYFKDTKRHKYE